MRVRRKGVLGQSIVVDAYGFEHLECDVTHGRWGKQKGRVIAMRDLDRPSSQDINQPRPRKTQRPRIVTPRPNYPDES